MDGIRTSLPPGRIGFQPLLPGLDTSALNEAADRGLAARSLVEVVLIGHFHDRRGHPNLCDVADPSACDGFVADAISSVGGARIPTSTLVQVAASGEPDVGLTWTADDVDRMILEAVPRLQILSRVALAGSEISSLEPALGTGALGIIDRPFAWLVTGLDPAVDGKPPVRRTFLLVDRTAEAYESAPWDVSNVGFIPFHLVGLPLKTASSPSLTCADGMPGPDCAAAASAVLESLTGSYGVPTSIEIGRGVWCPTPGLLFENTTCPAGGLPPTEGGDWIGHALVAFKDSRAQAYLNIARSGTVVRAKSIALATPPPSPN